uniref:Uncharacterized protein n=1 Tax=Arundo donax TaxID=35708 RepID=A0A0A9FUX9_ARUDO
MHPRSSSRSSSVTLRTRRSAEPPGCIPRRRRSHASSRSMSGDHEFCFCSPNGDAAGPLLFPAPPPPPPPPIS